MLLRFQKVFRLVLILAGVLLGMTSGRQALAGGGSCCGGAGNAQGPVPAWYTGPEPIRYCIEIAPDHGLNRDYFAGQIEAAFAHWQRYLTNKHVNDGRKPEQAIILNPRLLPSCDGTEALKFYIGGESPEVNEARKSYVDPIAFSHLTQFDPSHGKSKGFVWLALPGSAGQYASGPFPDWNNEEQITGILLHEIGHIAGTGYVDGTIMREDIAQALRSAQYENGKPVPKNWAGHIDGKVELYSCEWCAYHGKITTDPEKAADAFRKFVGRDPVGEVKASFTLKNRDDTSAMALVYQDRKGTDGFISSTIRRTQPPTVPLICPSRC